MRKKENWNIWYGEAKRENWNLVLEFLGFYIDEAGILDDEKIQIFIAVEEIFVNIASYAYQNDLLKKDENWGNVVVKCCISKEENMFYICLEDWGIPYNPLKRPEPDITLNAEERDIGGLGIFMVKNIMDQVEYKYEDNKNYMMMGKKF